MQSAAKFMNDASEYVQRKASAQESASSPVGGTGVIGGVSTSPGSSALSDGKQAFLDVENSSKSWGWLAGPIAGGIAGSAKESFGQGFSAVTDADSAARGVQDAFHGNYQGAFNEGSSVSQSLAYGVKGPGGYLVGANISLWTADEQAERAINWSYTMHHLSELNPFAPGALSAVGHAEWQGLKPVGEELIGGAISNVTGP
jgi:hypothetical protein